MLAHLPLFQHKIYVSAYATEAVPKDSHKVRTYRNGLEFIFHSLWYLPLLLWQINKDFKNGHHTVYFPTFHHWNLVILLLAKWKGKRSIYTVHNGKLHAGEDSLLNQKLQNWCIMLADELIFLTKYVERQTIESLPIRGKTHLILHSLLELPGLQFIHRQLPTHPKILFLGRIERYKGLELLLEAISGIPEAHISGLTIAGKAAYPILLHAGLKNIHLINKRSTESEIVELLETHDILVLPYLDATQSGILTLAIRAGLPCVITRVGGLPEQLEEQEAVFVVPTSEGIRRGIHDLIQQPNLYAAINKKLRLKANDPGWEKAGEKLTTIILKTLPSQ
ncbi:MAG: hypothetical protein DHS20C18_24930 [Saprospiraceae bacterium]|nr:MAG: hypothetical protein DHS20C18_24930 [Saprospiraceae bacterium]